LRVLIIDNYSPNSPDIYKLHDLVQEMVIDPLEMHNFATAISLETLNQFDVFILSDSDLSLTESGVFEQFHSISEFIRTNEKPIIGIAFGAQLIAMSFGVLVEPIPEPVEGFYVIEVVGQDPLFSEMANRFLVYKDYHSMIKDLPIGFSLIATSPNVSIEAFHHSTHPIYGIQFLPHIYDDNHPAGRRILENFFSIARLFV